MGDLVSGDLRHVVVRLVFGRVPAGGLVKVRVRVAWRDGDQDREGAWQELTFQGASDADCSAEARDLEVMHWVGSQHAEKAKTDALKLHSNGQDEDAIRLLDKVMRRLAEYASGDSVLVKALEELRALKEQLLQGSMTQGLAKEMRFSSQLSSRGQRDHRGRKPGRT